ncbi:S-layer homology domain-containing protein [Roseofilum sp. BLCC_M91]|uniref:S-layer homology domain-containing protein n=1 Tax=Roseofilum halophilum BLCC-M91 TaxID=3022259 RepID=A0ABT7BNX6_9CYAN|nr:S-layer homology domain-containing protein [Roseofilum halophilum]MDJ1180201.1 S-layer homology domain-containing protein [Roseofilum halophilum BLCC-M91]
MAQQQTVPYGYYAAKEAYSTLDWRLGNVLEDVPVAPSNFWDRQIQYNQLDLHPMSCTLFAAAGAISDLTGYRFSLADFGQLIQEARRYGFSDTEGWYINQAVDLLRRWWNNRRETIVSYRVDMIGSQLGSVLGKGYSVVTGYRGSAQYNADFNADGFLDQTSFGDLTYGHAVRMTQDRQNPSYARVMIDNYYGVQRFNNYRVRVGDISRLVENGVFYYSGYMFATEKKRMFRDVFPDGRSRWYYDALEWAVQENLISGYQDGTFRPNQLVTRAEMVVMLKRLYDKISREQ